MGLTIGKIPGEKAYANRVGTARSVGGHEEDKVALIGQTVHIGPYFNNFIMDVSRGSYLPDLYHVHDLDHVGRVGIQLLQLLRTCLRSGICTIRLVCNIS